MDPLRLRRREALAATAGGTFGYLYGKPVVVADGGVIVAFGAGTHIFCLRLRREECEPIARETNPLLAGGWTRVDPWADAASTALAVALRRANGR
jgi:hypothetical protein